MEKEPKRERLPVSVSAAVLIEDNEGRLLMLQQVAEHKNNRWGPPAGGMKSHEDPRLAATRETFEETGVEVEIIDLVGIYTADRGDTATGLAFVFRGRIIKGEISPAKGEIKDCRFFSPTEIEELVKNNMIYKPEYTMPAINDWLKGKSYPIDAINHLKGPV